MPPTKRPKRARATTGSPAESLAVVVPVYNSEGTIGRLIDHIVAGLGGRAGRLEIVLVNDGSGDGSHTAILAAIRRHPGLIRYIQLSRNFGEHNAVMCGLNHVTADTAVIIDDDFQNPPAEILKLVSTLREGFDVVYSYYDTKHHSGFRNFGSRLNDWAATRMLGKPSSLYLSSFKAVNRFVIDTVTRYDGPYPYLDGLILRATRSIGTCLCEHAPRAEGRSNYTLRRLVRLWLNMFTSFSVMPLRVSSLLGLGMALFGFVLAVFYLLSWVYDGLYFDHATFPPGWATLIIAICVFSGIQLCVLGMVGEYLGRVFMTQNRQPQYVVRRVFGAEDDDG